MAARSSSLFPFGEAQMAFYASSRLASAHRGQSFTRKMAAWRPVTLYSVGYCCGTDGSFEGSGSKRRCRGPVMAAKKASGDKKQDEGRYKQTIDLPKTAFGMRANATVREPEIQKLWEDNNVFKRVVEKNNGVSFIVHDGPPYANGSLHIGHALNKILKDIINRYKLLCNYKIHYIPGWDCHGLPIELKVLQSMDKNARLELTPLKLREKAAKFAKETVGTQMKAFKRYGIWADWENSYLTLDPEYEAAQIEVFGRMAMQGYIYRGRKPVHWSPSSRTALAEAELEYPEGHVSKSIYVILKIEDASATRNDILKEFSPNLYFAIWTTTPWTIPANGAIALNADLQYAVVRVNKVQEEEPVSVTNVKIGKVLKNMPGELFLVIALDLVSTLESKWGVKLTVMKSFLGSDLENCRYIHPVNRGECPVVMGGDYITTDSGTGLVHTAPGHGQEDYITGLKYGLPIFSPVDDAGKFTEEAGPFAGLSVLGDGNAAVADFLDEQLSVLIVEPYKHKYPYDWRTKKPTIFRATEQWFTSIEGFKQAAMDAIGQVKWVPPQAENRISSMTSSRSDWCISRQRTWGVPIPVFYHVDSNEPLITDETIEHVKAIICKEGSDAWWSRPTEELLPEKYRHKASEYIKGTDTMDVWFDSGSSWAAVLEKRAGLNLPADVYLEGTDQHRGWFQSSLLTSVATKGNAPYSCVVTHGFVLDEKGVKMSKSLGNVVDPHMVIEGKGSKDNPGYGADILRLWVSSVDYTTDVLIGPQIIRQMSDIYRKLRGTVRYLLSNLHDWKPRYAIPYHDLPMIDKYALFQLENVVNTVKGCYESYQFCKVFQTIQRFAVVDLSNFYFDVAKDRLYVGGTESFTRRSCQTTLAEHLLSIVKIIGPILPHLAEDAWQNLPFQHLLEDGSVAEFVSELKWSDVNKEWLSMSDKDISIWKKIIELRSEVNKVLETARTEKMIGSSLEAKVYLYTSDPVTKTELQELCAPPNDADGLRRIFITSQVQVLPTMDERITSQVPYSGNLIDQEGGGSIWIGVSHADGQKCERCWNYSTHVGSFAEHPTICERCFKVLDSSPLPTVAGVAS